MIDIENEEGQKVKVQVNEQETLLKACRNRG